MSFRNDHDAALARIAALERELAKTRDTARWRTESDSRTIEVLEREISELRRRRPDKPLRKPAPAATPPVFDELPPLSDPRGPDVSISALVLGAMFGVGLTILAIIIATT